MHLTFVETWAFSARWGKRQNDEALRALQNELLEEPSRGDTIPGCSILRKLRFGDESRGKGKRGGVRVIYVHTPEANRIDFIAVYGKDESDDLSSEQTKAICKLARLVREEAKAAFARQR